MNRRSFFFSSTAWAADTPRGDTLVVLFLRGGCDTLALLPPAGGDDRKIYEAERPNIAVAAPSLLRLDDHFGFHPSATGLHQLYQKQRLAVFVATGMKSNNRSHFDAQAFMELGTPDKKSTLDGWITRHLAGGGTANPFCSMAIGAMTPASLLGRSEATAILQPRRFSSLGGDKMVQADMIQALSEMYVGAAPVMEKGRSSLSAMQKLGQDGAADYTPKAGVDYPKNELGNKMRVLAQMLKMNLGVQVATVDMGGWDTHKYQGQGTEGTFAKQVEQLSGAVQAFTQDTEGLPLTLVIMSEFGRRLRENVNRGTDHGHGGMMMVLGPAVQGGRVFGHWPGLATNQLYERADLAVTTDFRQVLGEILHKRRYEHDLAHVFPEFRAEKDLGFIKA